MDMGIPAMTKCCNQLDVCYDTCGSNKYRCDSKFRWCLHSICSDLKKSLGFVSKVEGWYFWNPLVLTGQGYWSHPHSSAPFSLNGTFKNGINETRFGDTCMAMNLSWLTSTKLCDSQNNVEMVWYLKLKMSLLIRAGGTEKFPACLGIEPATHHKPVILSRSNVMNQGLV